MNFTVNLRLFKSFAYVKKGKEVNSLQTKCTDYKYVVIMGKVARAT